MLKFIIKNASRTLCGQYLYTISFASRYTHFFVYIETQPTSNPHLTHILVEQTIYISCSFMSRLIGAVVVQHAVCQTSSGLVWLFESCTRDNSLEVGFFDRRHNVGSVGLPLTTREVWYWMFFLCVSPQHIVACRQHNLQSQSKKKVCSF